MITCNGLPVLEMRLTMPLSGLWWSSILVDTTEPVTGSVTISQTRVETTYAGTVIRSGVHGGSCRLEAVGGTGGLATEVAAKSYRGATARTVVSDLLAAVGETLDGTSSRASLSTSLSFWTRTSSRSSIALATLAEALGARWRVRPNGKVWVGTDAWPSVQLETFEIDRDPVADTVVMVGALDIVPGVTFNGMRVGRVEHFVSADSGPSTTFWVEAA